MGKRNIFGELMEGVAAMKNHRQGTLTLRSYKVDVSPLPKVDAKLLRDTRKKLRCSRAVFAANSGSTREHWKNGNRAAQNRTRRRRLSSSGAKISGHAGPARCTRRALAHGSGVKETFRLK